MYVMFITCTTLLLAGKRFWSKRGVKPGKIIIDHWRKLRRTQNDIKGAMILSFHAVVRHLCILCSGIILFQILSKIIMPANGNLARHSVKNTCNIMGISGGWQLRPLPQMKSEDMYRQWKSLLIMLPGIYTGLFQFEWKRDKLDDGYWQQLLKVRYRKST